MEVNMTTSRAVGLLLSLGLLGGCSDRGGGPPTAPSQITGPSFDRGQGERKKEHLTGDASFFYNGGASAPIFIKYMNVAKRDAEGSVSGHFSWFQIRDGIADKLEGDVVCFTVIGNTVRVSGQITKSSTTQLPPGMYLIWEWQDNDGARSRNPDLTTLLYPAIPSTAFG